ncbi:MAG: hypothetical protein LQ344_004697 [Seirophora lacunosa]|nr:MAG: hypothetical protein LQ344_004697 [Seirophora lacunosa]
MEPATESGPSQPKENKGKNVVWETPDSGTSPSAKDKGKMPMLTHPDSGPSPSAKEKSKMPMWTPPDSGPSQPAKEKGKMVLWTPPDFDPPRSAEKRMWKIPDSGPSRSAEYNMATATDSSSDDTSSDDTRSDDTVAPDELIALDNGPSDEWITPDSGAPLPPDYKTEFLQACLSAKILTFGTYTLKSGRQSPYFFNAGSFQDGNLLSVLATSYAHTIVEFLYANPCVPRPDVLFGPAYKGIPLACCTLLELRRLDRLKWGPLKYSFNRKEKKTHGEGGSIVGAKMQHYNVLVIDDVVTAGTAMRESIEIVKREGGKVVGFVVALDRTEKMPSANDDDGMPRPSAMGQIRKEYGIPTASIVTLADLINMLSDMGNEQDMERLLEYFHRYGSTDEEMTFEGVQKSA